MRIMLILERKTCAYVLRHSIAPHDYCSSYGNQSLDEDVALDRCPSHNWDGNHDAWHWHGHTLGSLGAAIRYDVPSGTYSLGSGTTEAAIMLNILHLIVGIPALTLLPRAFHKGQFMDSIES